MGRPKGSKNKPKTVFDGPSESAWKGVRELDKEVGVSLPIPSLEITEKRRGRPKGSKNKATLEREALGRQYYEHATRPIKLTPKDEEIITDLNGTKSKRGRPKGSKNRIDPTYTVEFEPDDSILIDGKIAGKFKGVYSFGYIEFYLPKDDPGVSHVVRADRATRA